MAEINQNPAAILAEGKRLKSYTLLLPIASVAIYAMIVPIIFLDLSLSLYQLIYFSALGIPKIKKSQYIQMERWDLKKLNFWQRINCVYCEYANGIFAWAKAVGNQTELYSCAIKHRHALKDHEYEKKFYSEKLFN